MSDLKEIYVPDIGGAENVDVIEINVAVGDSIAADDSIITLESEKASMEVPAPFAGVIAEINVKVGDKVSEGHLILKVKVADKTDKSAKEIPAPVAEKKPEKLTPPAAEKPAANIISSQQVLVPDLGGSTNVEAIEVNVKVGDDIKANDTICVLESDKASMEVPSSHGGKITAVHIKVGDKVSMGDLLLTLDALTTQTTAKPVSSTTEKPAPTNAPEKPAPVAAQMSQSVNSGDAHAGPAVRRFARELGVDLTQVKGSGRKHRIVKEDVQAYVKAVMQNKTTAPRATGEGLSLLPVPQVDFTKFGEIERMPLNKIKKLTAQNLHRNWVMVPHVTQFDEADITEMEKFRQANKDKLAKQGLKLTPLIFIMKAAVAALKQFPQFNASLDPSGEELILKKYYNIGIAVDTPNGLVVPVIRDVDKKGMLQLAQELAEVSDRARDKGLTPKDMQGSCFTISSLGGIGGTAFTPIVNLPDVSILGVSRSDMKPVYKNGEFVPRLMLPLSLSYDHRVIDGAEGARFTRYLAECLSDIRQLLL